MNDILHVLEAAGRALSLGEQAPVDIGMPEIAVALRALDLSFLEDVGAVLAEDEATFETAFAARDRVEHIVLAAEQRGPVALSIEQETFLVAFDQLVRPTLGRLTVFNERRGVVTSGLAPALRRRFWWWSEGASLDPEAYGRLSAVAELVERFPDVRETLDRLVDAARSLRRPKASVTTLSEWLAKKRAAPAATLRVAAASGDETIVLVATDDYEIAFRIPNVFVIDLSAEPAAPPYARLPSGRVVSAAIVPRTEHRYRLELDAKALEETTVIIVVTLPSGVVEVSVPPAPL